MEYITIGNEGYMFFANSKEGTRDKYNRAANLVKRYDHVNKTMKHIIETKGITSFNGRASLGVLLLMNTGIRVGNEDSAEGYMTKPHPNQKDKVPEFVRTYGLTTLKKEHFTIHENSIEVFFVGKKAVDNSFRIKDSYLVNCLKELLNNETEEQYFLGVTDSELTKFIKTFVGVDYSPKDFRCVMANIHAYKYLNSINPMFFNKKNKATQTRMLFEYVSTMLNNTPAVCKKNYVSPQISTYIDKLFS